MEKKKTKKRTYIDNDRRFHFRRLVLPTMIAWNNGPR